MNPFRIVIPARYASSRLPGKPLREIAGKPMIQWVWEVAQRAAPESVHVATDDRRIEAAVRAFGGQAVMTSPDHASGTDRLAEVAAKLGFAPDDIIVNLQGDEPGMPPELVRQVAQSLADHPQAGIATLATPITGVDDLFDSNVVKVVLDCEGMALYFSRAPIPWVRDIFKNGPPTELPEGVPFLRHLGLYAYRAATLTALASANATQLEEAEALEQLRALVEGTRIHVSLTSDPLPHGVDTEDDLARLQARFC